MKWTMSTSNGASPVPRIHPSASNGIPYKRSWEPILPTWLTARVATSGEIDIVNIRAAFALG